LLLSGPFNHHDASYPRHHGHTNDNDAQCIR
jgi:hypothetical protein